MKIIQITSCCSEEYVHLFGLGDDGKAYVWNPKTIKWELDKAHED